MVISQVALSFLLIAGSGLMLQTVLAMQRTDLGFSADGVLKGHVLLPQARYADRPARASAVRQMLEEVRGVPGVEAVATVMPHPFRNQGSQPLRAEGKDDDHVEAVHHVVAGDYWNTMGIRLIEGRVFDDRDRAGTQLVTMISAGLARRLWPAGSAVGRRIRTSPATEAPWLTVVGVVQDVRKTFTAPLVGDTYVPHEQSPGAYLALMVRSSGDPTLLVEPLQRRLAAVAPDLPMHEVEPMALVVSRQARQQRFLATLLTVFAVTTVAIALVGLYTVLTFTVTTRRKEIAVRVAVGASRRQIGGAVVREGAVLVGAGLMAGAGLTMLSTRAGASALRGVTPLDGTTYAIAAAIFALVSLAAVSLPALRATKVDAVEALRID
jgi:putative ABC transport system permease protein